jgi:hypothetical protein
MANVIIKVWQAYIHWCDRMGLTPENRRCCMPRLEDPPLISQSSPIKSPDMTSASHCQSVEQPAPQPPLNSVLKSPLE